MKDLSILWLSACFRQNPRSALMKGSCLRAAIYGAAILFAISFSASNAVAACDIESTYVIYPSHINLKGFCRLQSEAIANCDEIARSHNYPAGSCMTGGIENATYVGWIFERYPDIYPPFYYVEIHWDFYFVSAPPPLQAESPDPCSKSGGRSLVGHPINVSNGSVVDNQGDCKSVSNSNLRFSRFYDSSNSSKSALGPGWRGSYSRRIVRNFFDAPPMSYVVGSPDYSAKYGDPKTACEIGFSEIKARVPGWSDATTLYVEGICQLIKNGVVVSTVPLHSGSGLARPLDLPNPVSYDVIRDDGQLIRFWGAPGSLRSYSGVSLQLTASDSGLALRDENDSIERYSSSGLLISITTRSGVTQLMGYDESGRLTSVVDSFGHRLTFEYDASNRLISTSNQ